MKQSIYRGLYLLFFSFMYITVLRILIDYGEIYELLEYKTLITILYLFVFFIEGWQLKGGFLESIITSFIGTLFGIGLYITLLANSTWTIEKAKLILSPWNIPFIGYDNWLLKIDFNSIFLETIKMNHLKSIMILFLTVISGHYLGKLKRYIINKNI